MFGTNWTMITPKKAFEGFDGLGLDKDVRRLFPAANAAPVFRLSAISAVAA